MPEEPITDAEVAAIAQVADEMAKQYRLLLRNMHGIEITPREYLIARTLLLIIVGSLEGTARDHDTLD